MVVPADFNPPKDTNDRRSGMEDRYLHFSLRIPSIKKL